MQKKRAGKTAGSNPEVFEFRWRFRWCCRWWRSCCWRGGGTGVEAGAVLCWGWRFVSARLPV